MKVIKKGFRLDVGNFSFSNSVVNKWNGLNEEIIQSKSLAGFKKRIIVSEMTYNVSMGTLNPTIPYLKKRIDYHLGYIRGFI